MQTLALKITGHQGDSLPNNKTLLLNGHSSIQLFTCHQCKGTSTYLEENVLIFVIEGALKIRSGNMEYEVNKNRWIEPLLS